MLQKRDSIAKSAMEQNGHHIFSHKSQTSKMVTLYVPVDRPQLGGRVMGEISLKPFEKFLMLKIPSNSAL